MKTKESFMKAKESFMKAKESFMKAKEGFLKAVITRFGIIMLSVLITIFLFTGITYIIKEHFNLNFNELTFPYQVGLLYVLTLTLYFIDILITEKVCKNRECKKRNLNVTAVQHFVLSFIVYSIALALFYLLIDSAVIITDMGLFLTTVTIIEYFYKKPNLI
jgi:hypothetical protein